MSSPPREVVELPNKITVLETKCNLCGTYFELLILKDITTPVFLCRGSKSRAGRWGQLPDYDPYSRLDTSVGVVCVP